MRVWSQGQTVRLKSTGELMIIKYDAEKVVLDNSKRQWTCFWPTENGTNQKDFFETELEYIGCGEGYSDRR